MRPARALTLSALVSSLATVVARAEEPTDDPPVVEIEVHGARPAAARDHVRTRELFESGTHQTGSDLMRTVPGVFITQHSGEGKAHQIFFRGFDAVHGQDLEISVGGVPVNEVSNIHGQGYSDLHFLMPEIVERVVALPGSLDATQGDFAVAGSLRYELGYPEQGVTAKVGTGSFGARRAFLAYHPAPAPAETFGAVELYESDGFGPARASERASLVLQWQAPLGHHLSLRALGTVYGATFGSAGVLRQRDIDEGLVSRLGSYDPTQGGDSKRSQLALEIGHSDESWRFEALPYFVFRSLSLRSNYTGALQFPETGDSTAQGNDALTVGLTSRVERQLRLLSRGDVLALGVSVRRDDIEQTQSTTALPPAVDARVRALHAGAYADLGLRPSQRILLHAALRTDALAFDVDDRVAGVTRASSGHFFGPKLSADILVVPGLVAFAGYGRGFRSPQARSLGDGESTPFTRVDSAEAGLRYHDGGRFSAHVAAFGSALEDDLVFDETSSRNEPAPATRRVGAAIDLFARGSHGFVSGCGSSYSRATFSEGDARFSRGEAVPYVPLWVLRCDMGAHPRLVELAGSALTAHLGISFGALLERPLPYGERGSDVFVVDARTGLGHGDVAFHLDVRNVFDTAWNDGEFVYASAFPDVPASAVPQRHVTAGEPRSVFATVTVHLR